MPENEAIGDLDDPGATALHADIIRKKIFLKRLYRDFYREFEKALSSRPDRCVVELGSGGGFLKEVMPDVVTSDILELPSVDLYFSSGDMPFKGASVDAFLMMNVMHHMNDVRAFFREAGRCLKPGGMMVMIEPSNTPWARFIYRRFHHELFDPRGGWGFEGKGPLSSANGALPWIVFSRDRAVFDREFPFFEVIAVRPHTPLAYLLSGGFTLRQLVPAASYPAVRAFERLLAPFNRYIGMYQTIVISKKGLS
ncbi:MAG: class I SAM-dependent methyltransferase [Candidatus Omnitrophica bacterium]|nr:class I SAM-dependent methyltransferase [Candidatus Omnitrophota bacterium]